MIFVLLALGCGQPAHLQYDFGRAYGEATATQVTIDRTSAAADDYSLPGTEALLVREAARKASSDKEVAVPTVTAQVAE